jgi:cell wall assembly regulator SMI1
MLTRKISDFKGRPQTQVQVMDLKNGQLIYFTLDELEKNELSAELKEYIRSILPDIEDGRWLYSGTFHK